MRKGHAVAAARPFFWGPPNPGGRRYQNAEQPRNPLRIGPGAVCGGVIARRTGGLFCARPIEALRYQRVVGPCQGVTAPGLAGLDLASLALRQAAPGSPFVVLNSPFQTPFVRRTFPA